MMSQVTLDGVNSQMAVVPVNYCSSTHASTDNGHAHRLLVEAHWLLVEAHRLLYNNWLLLQEWLLAIRHSNDCHCFGMICGLDNKSSCWHASVEELNSFVEMAIRAFEEVEVNFSVSDRL